MMSNWKSDIIVKSVTLMLYFATKCYVYYSSPDIVVNTSAVKDKTKYNRECQAKCYKQFYGYFDEQKLSSL